MSHWSGRAPERHGFRYTVDLGFELAPHEDEVGRIVDALLPLDARRSGRIARHERLLIGSIEVTGHFRIDGLDRSRRVHRIACRSVDLDSRSLLRRWSAGAISHRFGAG